MRPFAFLLCLLCLASAGQGYIDQPPEKLTLPKLLKEFKLVRILKARQIDAQRGKIIWEPLATLQGKPTDDAIKHSITLNGKVPADLAGIEPNQLAIFFSQDKWDRSLTFCQGRWYVCDWDAKTSWWRCTYTTSHYDFNCCFTGSSQDLADAMKSLIAGEETVVSARIIRRQPQTQQVRYVPGQIERKDVVKETPPRSQTRPSS